MTPHRQEEAKKRVPAHVRVVVDVHCPVCGASFDDIVRSGRAGCAECYHTFSDRLKPVIERIHGEAVHRGKVPGANLPQPRQSSQLVVKRRALREAIDTQNFEYAAALRDQIKALEEGGDRHA